MNNILYVPILKWKRGERDALKNLFDKHKQKITPLIEIVDYENPEVILTQIRECFNYPLYIDTSIAAEDDREFLLAIIKELNNDKVFATPIFYFDDLYNTINKFIPFVDRIGIRIPIPEDIDGLSYSETYKAIKDFKKRNSNVLIDVILDLNIIDEKISANRQLREVKNVIELFFLNESFYNLIIIASTSFPENISSIPAGSHAEYSRYDIKLFKNVYQYPVLSSLREKITYSDYGVTKFTDSEIDFSRLRYGILPKLKYTTYDKYIVLKGEKDQATRETIKSYIDLSKEVLNSSYYLGEHFSYGDLEIRERALGLNNKGPGSNANWVTIGTNHHITVVVEQLSKIPAI